MQPSIRDKGSHSKYLAVLHPKLFSVYELKKREHKETQIGDQAVIELIYQHTLKRTAHSFVLGSFGGVKDRSFICIQSLDGVISFYEQESFAFQLYLPTFILPSTFIYLAKTDSFLFLNGLLTFDCYNYEALASAASSSDKKIMKAWHFNLGEQILDVKTVVRGELLVIVLSERNLFILNENGKMICMKRLEYKPVALCSYLTEENKKLINIIATDCKFINLYEEITLRWSMKIDETPTAIERIFLKNLSGGIVLLSENGYIQVVYVGTHPSVYMIPPLVQPEINLQKAEIEINQLEQKMKNNDFMDPLPSDMVHVTLKLDKNIKIENNIKICKVIAEIETECAINNLQVLFKVEYPLETSNKSFMFNNCNEKLFMDTSVYLKEKGAVSDLTLLLIVLYEINETTRCIQKTETLPLTLVLTVVPPLKEAQHKVTILTNKPVRGMDQLFGEFSMAENSSNTLGLKFDNSEDVVTLLAAKSSQRYRIQSNALPSVSLLLASLIQRLKIYFSKDLDFTLTYSTPLPLDVFFDEIERHYSLNKTKELLEEKLLRETSQYRIIQKKILSNLRDLTSKPTSNLNKILKLTSQMISSSVTEMKQVEQELVLSTLSLKSLNRIFINLLELMDISDEDKKCLRIVFNPNVQISEKQVVIIGTQGWLETQEATASFLLRTVLAKSQKDQQKATDIVLKPLEDTKKLTKHLSLIIDRVSKGTHLIERNEFKSKKEPVTTVPVNFDSEECTIDGTVLSGLKYVDLNEFKRENTEKPLKKVDENKTVDSTPSETQEESDPPLVNTVLNVTTKEPDQKPDPEKTIKTKEVKHDDWESDDAIWDVQIDDLQI